MNKAYFMSFVFAAALPAMAAEEQYDPLFKGVKDGALVNTDGGSWVVPEDATVAATNDNKAVAFETAEGTPITLGVTAAPADTNTIVKVDLEVTLADVGTLMTSSELAGKLTAFAVCTNSFNAWNGSGWVALDEVPAGIDDSQTTNLTVEISYQGTNETKCIRAARFTVGDTTLVTRVGGSDWVELANSALAKDNLSGFGMNGEGIIAQADAEVMRGIAAYDGIKYGTISNAVEVARESGDAPAVEVLRETDEDVTAYAAEGVDIAAAEGVPVKIHSNNDVAGKSTAEGGPTNPNASGMYTATLPEGVAGHVANITDLQIELPFSGKEVKPGSVAVAQDGTVTFEVRTASSIVREVSPDGVKALSANVEKLQEFLAKTAVAKSDVKTAYEKANPTAEELAAELAKNGDNDIPMYQSYALGIDQNTSVKPVTIANDADPVAITLSIPALETSELSGDYTTVKYVLTKPDSNTEEFEKGANIEVPLSTGSYQVKIVME